MMGSICLSFCGGADEYPVEVEDADDADGDDDKHDDVFNEIGKFSRLLVVDARIGSGLFINWFCNKSKSLGHWASKMGLGDADSAFDWLNSSWALVSICIMSHASVDFGGGSGCLKAILSVGDGVGNCALLSLSDVGVIRRGI